jgi:hypothetical protein
LKKLSFIITALIIMCFTSVSAQNGSVLDKIEKGEITFKGGGLTIGDAVRMTGVVTHSDCAMAEKVYLEKIYGSYGKSWKAKKYELETDLIKKDGEFYGRIEVIFTDGRPSIPYYFHITKCGR